jgi:hypothetical protein
LPITTDFIRSQEEEEEEQALIFLQKLLRGRAIQNLMFEGKERRSELIRELKESESFVDLDETPREVTAKAHYSIAEVDEEAHYNMLFDQMLGAFVGNALDFLSKELVRVHQERKLAAMVDEAEKIRY